MLEPVLIEVPVHADARSKIQLKRKFLAPKEQENTGRVLTLEAYERKLEEASKRREVGMGKWVLYKSHEGKPKGSNAAAHS